MRYYFCDCNLYVLFRLQFLPSGHSTLNSLCTQKLDDQFSRWFTNTDVYFPRRGTFNFASRGRLCLSPALPWHYECSRARYTLNCWRCLPPRCLVRCPPFDFAMSCAVCFRQISHVSLYEFYFLVIVCLQSTLAVLSTKCDRDIELGTELTWELS